MAKYFSLKSFLALKDIGKTLPQESISLLLFPGNRALELFPQQVEGTPGKHIPLTFPGNGALELFPQQVKGTSNSMALGLYQVSVLATLAYLGWPFE